MIMTREQAWDLLTKYNKEPFHLRHAITVEHVMSWYARELGYGDQGEFWSLVGLLHDLDFEMWPEEHCEKSQELMREARENPPKRLGDFEVLAVRDYREDTRRDLRTGEVTETGLPSSNVLYYELSDNAWCCIRPSGTEPKIKYYFGVKGNSLSDAEEKLEGLKRALLEA